MKPPQIQQPKRSSRRGSARSRIRAQAKTTARKKPKAKKTAKGKTSPKKKARPTRAKAEPEEKSGSFRRVFIFLLVTGIAIYGVFFLKNHPDVVKNFFESKAGVADPIPDPIRYEDLKDKLASERQMLKSRFINALTAEEQDEILLESGKLLEVAMPELMRCWLGHPWDFNGTATVPGEGKIACGYFVSVIMRDAGFKVNRITLAQQPSQNIIRTFIPDKKDLAITSGIPYQEYVNSVESKYDGINIVGLDKHVAFIVIENGKLRFIHSGGLKKQVVDEDYQKAHSLEVSRYRVIGNITSNKSALLKWLLGDAFETVKR